MDTARKIRNHFGKPSIIGMLPSLKMNEMIKWESLLERDCAMLLEASRAVKAFWSQPFTFEYWDGQRYRIYTPDFLVELPGNKALVEVKPMAKLEKYASRYKSISEECSKNDLPFVVLTEKQIRVQPKLDNIKLLYRFAWTQVTLDEGLACRKIFQENPVVSLGAFQALLAKRGLRQELAYYLMYRQEIDFDVNLPITKESILGWRRKGDTLCMHLDLNMDSA